MSTRQTSVDLAQIFETRPVRAETNFNWYRPFSKSGDPLDLRDRRCSYFGAFYHVNLGAFEYSYTFGKKSIKNKSIKSLLQKKSGSEGPAKSRQVVGQLGSHNGSPGLMRCLPHPEGAFVRFKLPGFE